MACTQDRRAPSLLYKPAGDHHEASSRTSNHISNTYKNKKVVPRTKKIMSKYQSTKGTLINIFVDNYFFS